MNIGLFENETIEFKQQVNDSCIKTIVAFANCNGGKIYIGVADDGEITGVENIDDELLKLTDKMRANIRPDILMMTSTDVETFGNLSVIVVTVQIGTNRPYYLASKGLRAEGVYVRSGAASVPSSETTIRQIIHDNEGDAFESKVSLRQDLTFTYAKDYLSNHKINLGKSEMRTLGLLEGKTYTNLAFLLSDQCPSFVKAAVFEDNNRNVFLEREEFSGSILSQLENAYAYLESHDHFKTHYEGLKRIDYFNFPQEALREAIVNAVAHREYSLSGPTLISIMPSAIEIVSLGGLVSGITFEDLQANISMPRNKQFAALLYRLGNIEAWGTGIGRMHAAYNYEPGMVTIKTTPNTFSVLLANRNAKTEDRENNEFTRDEAAVINAIDKGAATRLEIQTLTGFSQTKTIKELAKLQSAGVVKKSGASKNTRYTLT
jgi:ATP-dependent DNA helicase RecG